MKNITPMEELCTQVRKVLYDGGERECDQRRTRTTGRVRYQPGGDGFRMHIRFDPAFVPYAQCAGWRRYLCLGHKSRSVFCLERLATILRAAGIPAQVAGSHELKSRRFVWVERVFDDCGRSVPQGDLTQEEQRALGAVNANPGLDTRWHHVVSGVSENQLQFLENLGLAYCRGTRGDRCEWHLTEQGQKRLAEPATTEA